MKADAAGGRARALAVLGTGSDVGKSVIAADLCRLLARKGVRVAPFKAQNMSLNSFVTAAGGEIGRAQALQAEACGLAAHVDMNPIVLKPESDQCAQVIVHGKVWGRYEGRRYLEQTQTFPCTITCAHWSDSGLSRMGFISTCGARPQASACRACARPISPPSAVTKEFKDMFCALKGATRTPFRARSRQRPAAMTLLPTSEPVPRTARARARPPAASAFTRSCCLVPTAPPVPPGFSRSTAPARTARR